ncbi:MAG: 2-amino-4-hydroxy-6-hydroxymethyldihydropteridine diphosphokinase [Planktomarina sp.]
MVDLRQANVTAFIALGANMAPDDIDLREALAQAAEAIGTYAEILTQSRTYRTPCFPAGAGPDYLNAAIAIEWQGESTDLLQRLHSIEQDFGRVRTTRWAARSLDLDIIAHGALIAPDTTTVRSWINLSLDDQKTTVPDQLILPHPRIQDRAFVLGPMMDIAPDWHHPVLGLTIRQMWDTLPTTDRAAIQPV